MLTRLEEISEGIGSITFLMGLENSNFYPDAFFDFIVWKARAGGGGGVDNVFIASDF